MANIVTTSKAIRFSKGSVAKIALAKAEEITTPPGVRVYGPYASVQIYLSDTIDGQSFATTKAMREYIDANFFYSGGGTGAGVQSVNGDTGPDVVLDAGDIGAATAAQGALADTAVQPDDIALEEGEFLVGGTSGNEKRALNISDFGGSPPPGLSALVWNNNLSSFSTIQTSYGPANAIIPRYTNAAHPEGEGRLRINDAVADNNAVSFGQAKNMIAGVYKFKGSVADEASLPTSDNTVGDVWNTLDTDMNFAWTGTEWDPLASTVDLSAYYTKSEIDAEEFIPGSVLGNQTVLTREGTGSLSGTAFQISNIQSTIVFRDTAGRSRFSDPSHENDAVNLRTAKSLVDGAVINVSANKTLALTDRGTYQNVTATSTITIPDNATVAFPIGAQIDFFQAGSGVITFAAAGGVTIISKGGTLATTEAGDAATLKKTSTNTWALIIAG